MPPLSIAYQTSSNTAGCFGPPSTATLIASCVFSSRHSSSLPWPRLRTRPFPKTLPPSTPSSAEACRSTSAPVRAIFCSGSSKLQKQPSSPQKVPSSADTAQAHSGPGAMGAPSRASWLHHSPLHCPATFPGCFSQHLQHPTSPELSPPLPGYDAPQPKAVSHPQAAATQATSTPPLA